MLSGGLGSVTPKAMESRLRRIGLRKRPTSTRAVNNGVLTIVVGEFPIVWNCKCTFKRGRDSVPTPSSSERQPGR